MIQYQALSTSHRVDITFCSVNCVKNHILTQFKVSKVRRVAQDKYVGNNMTIRLNHVL